MRIRLALPDSVVDADVLGAALEATTRANERLLAAGHVQGIEDAIRDGVRWKAEDFDDGEHFDLAPEVMARGWGDCDDLAPWLAAEMRVTGYDPGARAFVHPTAPNRWHAMVLGSNGEVYDPSRWAGMKSKQEPQLRGAVQGPMSKAGEGGMAVMPYRGGYAARVDIPWQHAHISGGYVAPTRSDALTGALRGAVLCGEEAGCDPATALLVGTALLGEGLDEDSLRWLDEQASIMGDMVPLERLGRGLPPGPGIRGLRSMSLPGGGTAMFKPGGPSPVLVRF